MYYNSIYSQLFNFIPRYRFEKIVKKSGGNRYCKHFTAWKQFLTLLFAQISGKDSLREIENALLANHKRLYHLGMEAVAKSTLSEAMNRCHSRYNWAYYRKHKGAIKLHTELDLSGNLPCFLLMSNGKMSDIRAAKENIPILPDSIVSQIKNLAFCGMKLFGTQVFNTRLYQLITF